MLFDERVTALCWWIENQRWIWERERERERTPPTKLFTLGRLCSALLSSQIQHGSQIQAVPTWPPSTEEPPPFLLLHKKKKPKTLWHYFLATVHTVAPSSSPGPSPPQLLHRFVASFGLYTFFSSSFTGWETFTGSRNSAPLLLSHPCCSFFLLSAEEVV